MRWQYLATQLQELRARLAHAAGGETVTSSLPTLLSRALVATRLLEHRCREEPCQGFETWLRAVADLLALLTTEPDLANRCDRALAELVTHGEELLQALDAGDSLLASVEPRKIHAIHRRFLSSWSDTIITEAQGGPRPESPVPARDLPRRLVLLVSGLLRASELHDRLKIAGYQVVMCSEPGEVAVQLDSGTTFQAVICDQVEPSRHLSRLVQLLQERGTRIRTPLILVTSGRRADITSQAHRLGAAGVWAVPFRTRQLQELLRHSAD